MADFPFLTIPTLTQEFRDRTEILSRSLDHLLPRWAEEHADHVLGARKLMICGSRCAGEIQVLSRHAEVVGIVDDFESREKRDMFGIPLVDSETWLERARKDRSIVSCILVWGPRAYQHFLRQCMQFQLPFLDPLQLVHLMKRNRIDTRGVSGRFLWYGHEYLTETVASADSLLSLCRHLDDEYSRISWLCILLYRITLNPFYLEACAVGYNSDRFGFNSYAINRECLAFSDDEVYVDGGAYHGDTIEQFLRAVEGRFRRIYSFEPLPSNNEAIRARLAKLQVSNAQHFGERIELLESGLWDSETTLHFNPGEIVAPDGNVINPMSAHIVETGILSHLYRTESERKVSIDVPVTTIDLATNEEATFIKLEIEGAEMNALKGATKTIERNRPKMALSIYHKPEDLVTITRFVLETGLGYRLAFRQHNPFVPDATVLYCR